MAEYRNSRMALPFSLGLEELKKQQKDLPDTLLAALVLMVRKIVAFLKGA
jgi:hypothetical protein